MQTNEHVADQRSPLFSWPVLAASKTIEIFNVKGDFFFFFGAGPLHGSALINIQYISILTQQVNRTLSQSQRLKSSHAREVVSANLRLLNNKKNISRTLLPSFYT